MTIYAAINFHVYALLNLAYKRRKNIMTNTILIVCLFLLIGCTPPQTYQSKNVEVHAAMKLLWKDNHESLDILKDVHAKGIHIHISLGELPGATLASTYVTSETATIIIDIDKVNKVHDNLVPVLAHEIYHTRDAFLLRSPAEFIALVDGEKGLPWGSRTVEKEAIMAEDLLRAKLLKQDPKAFNGMAYSRAEANRRAEHYSSSMH